MSKGFSSLARDAVDPTFEREILNAGKVRLWVGNLRKAQSCNIENVTMWI